MQLPRIALVIFTRNGGFLGSIFIAGFGKLVH
jgi:hypothetical protein